MNVIGEKLCVVESTDPSKVGITGVVLLDTAKTLVVESEGRAVRVEKAGCVFSMAGSKRIIYGSDVLGRLEDRWGGHSK